jgi:molecular chaperone GrpE
MSDVGSPQPINDAEVGPLSPGDRGAAAAVSPSSTADAIESADDVKTQFAELLRAVEESNRISTERERVIDRLYEENQRLRSGELEQALMPVLRDLMRLFDDLQKTVSSCAGRTSLDAAEVLREWEYYRDSTLDVLFRQGIEPCVARENSVFDPKEHRACGTVSTTDRSRDRTIARVIRVGFRTETRVLRTADVEVYRANTEAETQSKS